MHGMKERRRMKIYNCYKYSSSNDIYSLTVDETVIKLIMAELETEAKILVNDGKLMEAKPVIDQWDELRIMIDVWKEETNEEE